MSVGGGFSHTGGAFDPNGGRVVLDNTTNQTLATTFNDLVINDGLLAYWKLDEGTDSTAADSSGYGYDGVVYNGLWSNETLTTMDFYDPNAFRSNRADSSEYVLASNMSELTDAQTLTLSAWVRLDGLPANYMRFITLENEKAVLRYTSGGGLQFYVKIDGSLPNTSVSGVLTTGQWYHVAGTYDGSVMRLYLDGTERDTNTVSGSVAAGSWARLSHSSNDEDLDGLLDDVRIYNRALSLTEIQALAAGNHPQTSIATTSLGAALDVNGDLTLNSGTLAQPQTEGYWKLDEGSGDTAADSSGNGYDGTFQNTPTWSTNTPSTHFTNSNSLSFDRADADYVNIPGTTNINGLSQISLSAWVRLASTPTGAGSTYMRFITLGNEKAVLRYHDDNGTGKLEFYMTIGGSMPGVLVDHDWATDTWYHVAGTYDGSDMRLYLNGALQGSPLSATGTVTTGNGVLLSTTGGEALDGLLDDVRVYSRASPRPKSGLWRTATMCALTTSPSAGISSATAASLNMVVAL